MDAHTFSIVVNGKIGTVRHRFRGGNGEPEIFTTAIPDEIDQLQGSKYATRIVSSADKVKAVATLKAMTWDELRRFASIRGVKQGTREVITNTLMETLS